MKVKPLSLFCFCLALITLVGLACNFSTPVNQPVIIKFPTISGQTETAVFESTLWTPTSTGTITLIPTITDTLAPSNTPKPPTRTATEPTATATLQYTYTPSITFTASVTPHRTKTASMTPSYAAYSPTPLDFACKVESADPNGYKSYHTNDDFDAHFTVYNSGAEEWSPEKVSYRFINGTALHKFGSSFAINNNVQIVHTYSATIDMKAPGKPGRYTSVWSFEHSQKTMCLISFSINVLEK